MRKRLRYGLSTVKQQTNQNMKSEQTKKTVCEIIFDSPEWLELDRLARKAGYHSAQICANETGQWRATVEQFKEFLTGQGRKG
jgi:hypothetical protein